MRTVAGVVLALALLVSGTAFALPNPTLRIETVHADLGYIGCWLTYSSPYLDACMVAYSVPDGVRVIFTSLTVTNELPTPSYTEELILPSGSLRAVERSPGFTPAMEFEADLPRTGHVYLRSNGNFGPSQTAGSVNTQCNVDYEIVADDQDTIIDAAPENEFGSINGRQVIDQNCNNYWVGPASGVWSMTYSNEQN
jgi:hypothetical protein